MIERLPARHDRGQLSGAAASRSHRAHEHARGGDQLWLLNEAGYWLLGPSREVEWSSFILTGKQQTQETRYPDAGRGIQRGPGSGNFATEGGLLTYVNLPRELSDAAAGGSIEPTESASVPAWILIAFTPHPCSTPIWLPQQH